MLYLTPHANVEMVRDQLGSEDIRDTIINGDKNKNHRGPGYIYKKGVIDVIATWKTCHCTVVTAYNENHSSNSSKDKSWRRKKYMDRRNEKTCPRCGKADLEFGHIPLEISDIVIGDFPGLRCPNCKFTCFDEETSKIIRDVIRCSGILPLTSEEQCLLLLFASNKPIRGATIFMKEAFLLFKEKLNEFKIPAVSPNFISHYYGPYSFDIEEAWQNLEALGLIEVIGKKSSRGETFYLTEEGTKRAKQILESLPHEIHNNLYEWRRGLDELGREGILKVVYQDYPQYLEKSRIKNKILPNWAHRRA